MAQDQCCQMIFEQNRRENRKNRRFARRHVLLHFKFFCGIRKNFSEILKFFFQNFFNINFPQNLSFFLFSFFFSFFFFFFGK